MSKPSTPNEIRQEQQEQLLGETLLLGLLGKIIYQYPEKDQRVWFQSLIDTDAFAELPVTGGPSEMHQGLALLQNWSRAGISDQAYADLQADYLRMFVGPAKVVVPPWESVFFNEARQMFQDQTLQVRTWYRRFGLEPEKLYHEPDDHIGLELIFVAHLANQALLALDQADQAKFDSYLDARSQFLTEHLLKWAFAWCDLVTSNAHTDFYKGVALLTRGALQLLAERYDLQVGDQVTA